MIIKLDSFFMPFASNTSLLDVIFHHVLDSKFYFVPFGFNVFAISKHIVVLGIVSISMAVLLILATRSTIKNPENIGNRLAMLIESIMDFIENELLKNLFQSESRTWLPFFCTMFFLILFCNLFGLIPGSSTVTGNIGTTFALASVTFIATQAYGMKKLGVFGYWKSLVPNGIPSLLAPLMFAVEFIGLWTKPFALTMRLFANMIAGHIIILVLLHLGASLAGHWLQMGVAPITVLASSIMNIFEIFISTLQAYIFTFLSAMFISEAGKQH